MLILRGNLYGFVMRWPCMVSFIDNRSVPWQWLLPRRLLRFGSAECLVRGGECVRKWDKTDDSTLGKHPACGVEWGSEPWFVCHFFLNIPAIHWDIVLKRGKYAIHFQHDRVAAG